MLFNSLSFIFFLPVVVILYYLIPHHFRWIILLLASCYFYMTFIPVYIFILFAIILVNFSAAISIEKAKKIFYKNIFFIACLSFNVGILAFFKYWGSLNEFLNHFLKHFNHQTPAILMNLIFPIGLSFQIFQSMGYLLDVYYKKQTAERHIWIYALFVLFFPLQVAGPIERFSRLGGQFMEKHTLKYENLANGCRLILYGFFIKMVIADNLSFYVDQIFSMPKDYNSANIITSAFLYSFQIYSDFYGYSLIAIGSAQLFGIRLIDNFKTPYLSKNIMDFWGRWHISLTSWLRDYLYTPLSLKFRYRGIFGVVLAVLITFGISGLWHGAGFTFLIWGFLHGLFLLLEAGFNKLFNIKEKKKWTILTILNTLKTFIIVTALWIFFRCEDLTKTKQIFVSIAKNFTKKDTFSMDIKVWILLIFFILMDVFFFNNRYDSWVSKKPVYVRWFTYSLLIFAIMVMSGVENTPFIYFKF